MHATGAQPPSLLGQRVRIGGTALNGRFGKVLSFDAVYEERYAVSLEGGGGSVMVRPANLQPAEAIHEEIFP